MSVDDPRDEGGESACYAALVCQECGAIVDDDHHHDDAVDTVDTSALGDGDAHDGGHDSESA